MALTHWIDTILASSWMLASSGSIEPTDDLQPERFIRIDALQYRFADRIYSRDQLEAGMPRDVQDVENIDSFHILHGGWRIASFRKFRPLAYFCAFGPMEAFECLYLAVASLLAAGRWRHEILVITAPADVSRVRGLLAPLALGDRLQVVSTPSAADPLDWCLARFRLDLHPLLSRCRPLLYLDIDIMCDRPLDALLTRLLGSTRIHAKQEGKLDEGNPDSDGRWFGWRLLAADGVSFDPKSPGFSAGALGVAGASIARVAFDLVLASSYGHAWSVGRRLPPYDQAVTGYVFRKLGVLDLELMNRFLSLNRIDGPVPEVPAGRPPIGLVHFTGGDVVSKHAAMSAYAKHLGMARRLPAQAAS